MLLWVRYFFLRYLRELFVRNTKSMLTNGLCGLLYLFLHIYIHILEMPFAPNCQFVNCQVRCHSKAPELCFDGWQIGPLVFCIRDHNTCVDLFGKGSNLLPPTIFLIHTFVPGMAKHEWNVSPFNLVTLTHLLDLTDITFDLLPVVDDFKLLFLYIIVSS